MSRSDPEGAVQAGKVDGSSAPPLAVVRDPGPRDRNRFWNARGIVPGAMVSLSLSQDNAGGVRQRRQAVGLTQIELAARAGCALSSVFNLEAGIVPRRSRVVPRILAVLDQAERDAAGSSQGGSDGH